MADNNISCELNKKGPTITKETIKGHGQKSVFS